MKLTNKQVKDCLDNFHFELTEEELRQEWRYDKDNGFQTISKPLTGKMRCVNLRTDNGCWIRLDMNDLTQAQIEDLIAGGANGCQFEEVDPEEMTKRFNNKYMDKAVVTDHGWVLIRKVMGFATIGRSNKGIIEVQCDIIESNEKASKMLTKYRAECLTEMEFRVDPATLELVDDVIDESFEGKQQEIYDYLGKVCDQAGNCIDKRDRVVYHDDGLYCCVVVDFNPDTLEYLVRDLRSKKEVWKPGRELLVVVCHGGC